MNYQESIPVLRPGKAQRKAMVSVHPMSQGERPDPIDRGTLAPRDRGPFGMIRVFVSWKESHDDKVP